MCDARRRTQGTRKNGLKIEPTLLVIARFMRATQLDHPDKPGDDKRHFRYRLDSV
jgi:hypothetical protein